MQSFRKSEPSNWSGVWTLVPWLELEVKQSAYFARLLITRERRVRASLGTLLSFEPRQFKIDDNNNEGNAEV